MARSAIVLIEILLPFVEVYIEIFFPSQEVIGFVFFFLNSFSFLLVLFSDKNRDSIFF